VPACAVLVLLYVVPLTVVVLFIISPVEKFIVEAGRPVAVSKTGLIAVAKDLACESNASTRSSS